MSFPALITFVIEYQSMDLKHLFFRYVLLHALLHLAVHQSKYETCFHKLEMVLCREWTEVSELLH